MQMTNESEEMYASKYTCPHVEPASSSISISVPVSSTTSQKLLVKACPSCADLHSKTGVGSTGEYLPAATDRQVGLGVLGLANLLRRYGVSYEQFGVALEQYLDGEMVKTPAFELVVQLGLGIDLAASIARANNMVRAFAIAPTASCSYHQQGLGWVYLYPRNRTAYQPYG